MDFPGRRIHIFSSLWAGEIRRSPGQNKTPVDVYILMLFDDVLALGFCSSSNENVSYRGCLIVGKSLASTSPKNKILFLRKKKAVNV